MGQWVSSYCTKIIVTYFQGLVFKTKTSEVPENILNIVWQKLDDDWWWFKSGLNKAVTIKLQIILIQAKVAQFTEI